MSEENGQQAQRFDPSKHLIQLKSRQGTQDYLPVQFRILWFRLENPQGTIDTEEVVVDLDRELLVEVSVWSNEKRRSEKVVKTAKGYARFKAIVTDGKGGRATAHGSESAVDFADFVEKAETKALGRALGEMGYGTQFAPDLDEGPHLVDSPVEHDTTRTADTLTSQRASSPTSPEQQHTPSNEHSSAPHETAQVVGTAGITEQQIESIRKLCQHLSNKPDPDGLTSATYAQGKAWIAQLNAEYKEYRANSGIVPR